MSRLPSWRFHSDVLADHASLFSYACTDLVWEARLAALTDLTHLQLPLQSKMLVVPKTVTEAFHHSKLIVAGVQVRESFP